MADRMMGMLLVQEKSEFVFAGFGPLHPYPEQTKKDPAWMRQKNWENEGNMVLLNTRTSVTLLSELQWGAGIGGGSMTTVCASV